jgi:hypothetical protein
MDRTWLNFVHSSREVHDSSSATPELSICPDTGLSGFQNGGSISIGSKVLHINKMNSIRIE